MFSRYLLATAYENLAHVMCVLLLIARLGDVITTRLATPTLALEANAVVRRLGWWFAALSVLLFYPNPHTDWGFWVGAGILVYALAIAVHGTTFIRRLFREAGSTGS